jgi:hypothetical protein
VEFSDHLPLICDFDVDPGKSSQQLEAQETTRLSVL